ncbi:pyridoxal phosphate-dependent aminotransferase [Desulfolutivibrio sulfoxidireducens]|uniref:pyridoxal phosphate-dependent aminotransferase n=1 Tax=Desulfolutivibrio sulfoxidireducens TaxID=2773299 RepID=UPI00159DA925|nr:pyridoxal phosphate-dependent aminotransferase [Desulfolutivibrio sulfoxidireducens]QLA16659.1 aminotransferase class I/II-fold pyridoxal phosphate-dependent enzyme [Desulfolutivibrio sulfoxidireducens]
MPHTPASPRFSRRAGRIKISATKLMPMLAAEVGGCVSLGQGVPSFATPDFVVDAVCAALRHDPAAGKYSLQPGLPDLRRAVAGLLAHEKGLHADPVGEILIAVGAMEALLAAMLVLVDRGDEVIVPAPSYPSHVEQILLAEGTPVFARLRPDFSLDPEAVARAVTEKTRAIIVSSPHNPTGAVFAEPDLRAVADIAIRHDLTVICDDTYDSLSYDAPAFSLAALPELRERLVAVGSFSKRFALTGWRVGHAFAPRPIMDQMLKIHDCATICAPMPGQIAALAALTGPQDVFTGFARTLARRRDLACRRLDALAGHLDYIRPAGAFYVMARYHEDIPPMDMAVRLIREAGVITIPGDAFGPGGEQSLRLSFGAAETELNEAFDRLEEFFGRERGETF